MISDETHIIAPTLSSYDTIDEMIGITVADRLFPYMTDKDLLFRICWNEICGDNWRSSGEDIMLE